VSKLIREQLLPLSAVSASGTAALDDIASFTLAGVARWGNRKRAAVTVFLTVSESPRHCLAVVPIDQKRACQAGSVSAI
jgi:hypothetical protein